MMRTVCSCLAVALLVGIFSAACAPGDCSDAESHCVDAHTIEACTGSVDAVGQSRHSSTTACPAATPFCVDTSGFSSGTSAACSASATKAPECAALPNGQQCVAGNPVQCENGYLFALAPCDSSHTCVVGPTSHYALCALSASPDPVCANAPAEYRCDGDAQLHCYDGFLLAKVICNGACDTEDAQCDEVAVDAGDAGDGD